MKRSVAFILLLVIIIGGWALFTFTGIHQLLDKDTSPVLFTYKGTEVTAAWLVYAVLFVVGWLTLTVIGFMIDPILGYYIFRLGLFLLLMILDKDSKFDIDSKSGSGSGRSGRGG